MCPFPRDPKKRSYNELEPHERTKRTRLSYMRRVVEAFGTEEAAYALTHHDYDEVHERLGWSEGTFMTYLRYLGKPTGKLKQGTREYVATDEDFEILSQHLNPNMMTTMAATGCRFGQLWTMTLQGNILMIPAHKRGKANQFNLTAMDLEHQQAIKLWVMCDRFTVFYDAARKKWQRLIWKGLLSAECTAHAFRYRVASKLAEAGADVCEIADYLGHQSLNTTRGYIKRETMGKYASKLLIPDKVSPKQKVTKK